MFYLDFDVLKLLLGPDLNPRVRCAFGNVMVMFFISFFGAIHLIFFLLFSLYLGLDILDWFIDFFLDLVNLIRLIKPMDHMN